MKENLLKFEQEGKEMKELYTLFEMYEEMLKDIKENGEEETEQAKNIRERIKEIVQELLEKIGKYTMAMIEVVPPKTIEPALRNIKEEMGRIEKYA